MQTSLMFLDLPLKGSLNDIDKIAIKLPKGQGALENGAFGGFADVINALMATVPADELHKSLDQLEWVPVEEGGVPGFAPLIDLTQAQAREIGMAKRLLNEAAPETFRQAEALKSVLFPSAETVAVKEENIDSVNRLKVPTQDIGFQKRNQGLTGQQLETVRGGFIQDVNGVGQENNQTADPEPADLKSKSVEVIGNSDAQKIKTREGANEKDVPPALQRIDKWERQSKIEPTEKHSSRMVSLQQQNGQVRSEGETGQQFADNPEQEAMPFGKQDAKTRFRDDAPARDFKPGIVENSMETSKESNDPLNKTGTEMREPQSPMAKSKPTFGERMENVSGAREMGSNSSQETQNNVIRQIVQRMTLHTQGNQSTMTLKLKPEFLGQVQMQISTDQQQVIVRMATESLAVKEMVEQGLQHLKSELQQHGLEIDKFDVFVTDDNEGKKNGQDWAGFRQALKRRQQGGMKQGRKGSDEMETSVSDDVEGRRAPDNTGEVDYFA